ncbi:MAG: cysteine peptidase family C39 domain-containing protein [Patescibacteria group bacterium]
MRIKKSTVKFLLSILLSLIVFAWNNQLVLAQNCDEQYSCSKYADDDDKQGEYSNCLNNQRTCWESKINQAKTEANTLQSTINILNGQIQLQSLKIQQTVNEINQLEKEIDELTQRIEGLSISLDKLSGILIERVRASYKQSRKQFKVNFFASDSFNQFISQYHYLNQAQEQTLEVMHRTELQRATYDQQKRLKEEKQEEIARKKSELERQKVELDTQKNVKNSLLAETKNNEAIYQQKLAEANAQLASFSRFASTLGVSLLSNQTHCSDWGCYYSQRDAEWGNVLLGTSNVWTIAKAGCLVTSVSMITSHYNKTLTPKQIASNSSLFDGAFLNFELNINGILINRKVLCYNSSCLDGALEGNNPVVVRLDANNFAGTHFIVITKKEDGKYIMHDPAMENGHDKNFIDHYSLSLITRVDRVSVQ